MDRLTFLCLRFFLVVLDNVGGTDEGFMTLQTDNKRKYDLVQNVFPSVLALERPQALQTHFLEQEKGDWSLPTEKFLSPCRV